MPDARPFYFLVPFWGERYRNYFTELCLPSLLAPGNIPLLRQADGHRFLIATTAVDWAAIKDLPVMARLSQHATPTWIDIEPAEISALPDLAARYSAIVARQTLSQKKLVEAAYRAGAYGFLMSPDVMFTDGTVALVLAAAAAGEELVLCPALRQSEEPVLADLARLGFLTPGEPLVIPPRVAADLAVRHLHRELDIFEEGNPNQPFIAPFRFWRLERSKGLMLYTFFGLPVLMDFTVLGPDHSACLESGVFEYVYLRENFRAGRRVRVIRDSDEMVVLSVTPGAAVTGAPPIEATTLPRWFQHYDELASIRTSMNAYVRDGRDWVKWHLFRQAVRWHAGDFDGSWAELERRLARLVDAAVGDYYRLLPGSEPNGLDVPRRAGLGYWLSDLILFRYPLLRSLVAKRRFVGQHLLGALRGELGSLRWLFWRLHVLWRQIRGKSGFPPFSG